MNPRRSELPFVVLAALFVGAQSKFLGVLEAYKDKLPAEPVSGKSEHENENIDYSIVWTPLVAVGAVMPPRDPDDDEEDEEDDEEEDEADEPAVVREPDED